jgi:uncharacterized phage protein (TIGR02218 family)
MRSATNAMKTHLAEDGTKLAMCWKIKRRDGEIRSYTNHDQDINFDLSDGDGSALYAASTGFARSAISTNSNFEADSLEVNSFLDASSITDEDIRAGKYDNAIVTIFLVTWDDTTRGKILLKKGWIGSISQQGNMFVAELLGLLKALDRQIQNVFDPLCNADFGDARCGFTPTVIGPHSIATIVDGRTFTTVLDLGTPANFIGGLIKWTSGPYDGENHEIKSYVQGTKTVTLFLPFSDQNSPNPGETFLVQYGCKKTLAACIAYGNVARYRGFPHIPTTDRMFDLPKIRDLVPFGTLDR